MYLNLYILRLFSFTIFVYHPLDIIVVYNLVCNVIAHFSVLNVLKKDNCPPPQINNHVPDSTIGFFRMSKLHRTCLSTLMARQISIAVVVGQTRRGASGRVHLFVIL